MKLPRILTTMMTWLGFPSTRGKLRHDYEMVFRDDTPGHELDFTFICKHCGDTTADQYRAMERMRFSLCPGKQKS